MPIKQYLLLLSSIVCVPLTVHAQELPSQHAQPTAAGEAMLSRARYLERWLGWMSRAQHRSRINRGVWKLVAAGAFGASATAAVVANDTPPSSGAAVLVFDRPRLQPIALTAGTTAALLADGIVSLSTRSNEEERYQRWLALRRRDHTTVALFEGELAAAATESRRAASFSGALWIGIASAGATMLVLTPLERFAIGNERAAYAMGAVLFGIGTWKAIASFVGETWNEEAYRLYQERQRPRAVASLSVSPWLAANSGGLTLDGTF